MAYINLPRYDECRKWIAGAREHKIDWEQIKYARRQDEQGLIEFLKQQILNNFWPDDLNELVWFELVNSEKEAEERSLELGRQGGRAMLVDEGQDNALTVPTDNRSSWQLYKKHLVESGWKSESINEIERATIGLLKRLNRDTTEVDPVKGLVIGHVQSGKTANMAALMAMAADWGWNFFVVLSGTIENLRKQTQSRLFRDLNRPGNIIWGGLEHLSKKSSMGNRAQDLRLENDSNMRYFTVCLKNSGRLKNLIEWMQQDLNKRKQMRVIVIDDEADQASINTADINSKERAKINELIVNLVEGNTPKSKPCKTKVQAMNYISYTATPYANFLNESAPESLYPRNFIRTLQPSNEYFGPRQIFGIEGTEECDGLNIVRVISEDDLDMLKSLHNEECYSIPKSLKDSICWFLCGAAAMRFFGHSKPISMLVHTSQKQQHHQRVSNAIRDWLSSVDKETLLKMCKEIWNREKEEFTLQSFREVYKEYGRLDEEINQYPDFSEIVEHIKGLSNDITNIPLGEDGELQYQPHLHLCVDNCANNGINEEGMFVRLAYPDPEKKPYPSPAPAFIIVGGSTLSRGLTIEGLISTYFLRSTCQADSLMQMGRWFGYRKGYELIPRIWMTRDTMEKFKFLAQLEAELRENLYEFMVAGADPLSYGPKVKNTPKISWLRITAKNRMQSAKEVDMDFTGTNSQTILFDDDKELLSHNIEITHSFMESLGQGEDSHSGTALVWRGVQFTQIANKLLKMFKFQNRARVFSEINLFAEWVEKLSASGELDNWNVVAAGQGQINDSSRAEKDAWDIGGKILGKVNRSRKKVKELEEDIINIGVLRAPKDLLADIDKNKLEQAAEDKLKEVSHSVEVNAIRAEAGLARTPQLLIYRISKDSKARSLNREDLNASEDIIGLCISIPGSTPKSGKSNAQALTIRLDNKSINNENWRDEE